MIIKCPKCGARVAMADWECMECGCRVPRDGWPPDFGISEDQPSEPYDEEDLPQIGYGWNGYHSRFEYMVDGRFYGPGLADVLIMLEQEAAEAEEEK